MTADLFVGGSLAPGRAAVGATFSPCRKYRYRLWRMWDFTKPFAVFLMMNPSTADEINDDPTVHRQQVRSRRWLDLGFPIPEIGGVEVVNIFAWRETDSRKLPDLVKAGVDIVGPDNDRAILEAVEGAGIVVCGWGKPGALQGRGEAVLSLLRGAGVVPHALGVNADGSPQHPLYIGYRAMPLPMVIP